MLKTWPMRQLWLGYWCVVLGSVLPRPACAKPKLVANTYQAFNYFFGVYLQEAKVGWMQMQLQKCPDKTSCWHLQSDLHAQITGMNQQVKLSIVDSRHYDHNGTLLDVTFVQTTPTSENRVEGGWQNANHQRQFWLRSQASEGGKQTLIETANLETLQDVMLPWQLAQRAGMGNQVQSAHHLDPAVGQSLVVNYTVVGEQLRRVGGVDIPVVQLRAYYPQLMLSEDQYLDRQGKVLETRLGKVFVARLEDEVVAKKMDASFDLLQASVVAVPKKVQAELALPMRIDSLELTMQHLDDYPMPSDGRQKVLEQKNHAVRLQLEKEAMLPGDVTFASLAKQVANDANLRQQTEPTAFLQSDAPAIVQKAKLLRGKQQNVKVVVEKLLEFVHSYVKDEYVPAFSSALEVLRSGKGDCTEHSVLLVALCRALHIPAKVVVGLVYWPQGKGFGWHAWSEVFVGGRYYQIDPTWNQMQVDATHIKLSEGGPLEQARIVALLGKLKISHLVL